MGRLFLTSLSWAAAAPLLFSVAFAAEDPASLNRLHDIVVPAPVPWWPPAPGWYFVLAALALAVIYGAARALATSRANAYRRIALAELANLEAAWNGNPQDQSPLATLPVLLKRVALAAFPREQVASLSGTAWCEFLDITAGHPLFAGRPAEMLHQISYESPAPRGLSKDQVTTLFAAARTWVRCHHSLADPAHSATEQTTG